MNTNIVVDDSGMYKVLTFLKGIDRGTLLAIDDFKGIGGLTYTNIRTILVCLCNRNILIRICRGVYCYPKCENDKPIFPSVYSILSQIAQKSGYEICPTGEYAKYILGIRATIPDKIICYNNNKIKTINLENGISVKIIPSKRCFTPFIKSWELRLLFNYISSIDVENISISEKRKLKLFFDKISPEIRAKESRCSSRILSFLD